MGPVNSAQDALEKPTATKMHRKKKKKKKTEGKKKKNKQTEGNANAIS